MLIEDQNSLRIINKEGSIIADAWPKEESIIAITTNLKFKYEDGEEKFSVINIHLLFIH